MSHRSKLFWLTLLSLLVARLFTMAWLPLMDTSEPRYAEIARVMMQSNDWITPWFAPGVPFWGKPPLSFWAQALAMDIGGVNEFAVRMPGLLAVIGVLALLYALGRQLFDIRTARLATMMCASAPLMWLTSGAVVTDPFLTLGVTLSLVALPMAVLTGGNGWRYGFFVGLAIGLLAKGPLALVLTGFPVLVAGVLPSTRQALWRALPWGRGIALTLLLTLPWYIAAELKTPGFLRYFLWGEHVLRFLQPGWSGDLYGNGHQRPHGLIWIYLLAGALPWMLVGLVLLLRRSWRQAENALTSPWVPYLVAWSVVTGLLFTPASNILPTYVQPSLPALCLLVAALWRSDRFSGQHRVAQFAIIGLMIITAVASGWMGRQGHTLKSEKSLIAALDLQENTLVYLGHKPYSAEFYSQGKAMEMDDATLAQQLQTPASDFMVAIPQRRYDGWDKEAPGVIPAVYRNRRYVLVNPEVDSPARAALLQRLAPGTLTPGI